jgi:Fe-S cluster assembly protein SufD
MYFSTEWVCLVQPRNLVIVGKIHVQIIERHQSLNENQYWPIQLPRFLLKNVPLDFYKIQNDNLTANLIDNTYVSQKTRK